MFNGGENTNRELYHLIPDTHYYARFVAENSAGKTVLPLEFTTLPVAKPEVGNATEVGDLPSEISFFAYALSPTTVGFSAIVESNGATTNYAFGYATSPSGPVTVCATGSISVAEDFAEPVVDCGGLAPETTYYVHLIATNEKGTIDQTKFCPGICSNETEDASTVTTETAKPVVETPSFRNITANSAHVTANFTTHDEETHWRFESAPSMLGPWTIVAGGTGVASSSEASGVAGVTLTGLSPASSYYVRLFAENAAGEAENYKGEPVFTEKQGFGSFTTTGPPTATTLAVHALHGESLRLIGAVDPNNQPTSAEQTVSIEGAPTGGSFTLTFAGQTTAPIAFNASPEDVGRALEKLPGEPDIEVDGPDGGPYTAYFGNDRSGLAGRAVPELEADGAGLTPSGLVAVAVTQEGGVGYDTHYHFQYVSEEQFKGGGEWSGAVSIPEVDLGSGVEAKYVTAELPALSPGETYRYRVVATSTFPGGPVDGAEQSLAVPATPVVEASAVCPNEALRTGASANLPDCRGYEQLTPVDKEGARELFNYGGTISSGVIVSEDGERVMLEDEAVWGSGAGMGQGPYLFSRESGSWRLTDGAVQPETGVDRLDTELFAPDLKGFAFHSFFNTSPVSESKEVEYRTGPPGGPYVTVASVPTGEQEGEGWVGASQDFSRLFLSVSDHTLLGYSTGTRHGGDLYEYSDGELSQVNVTGPAPGTTIGSCGATVVNGDEDAGTVSSAHAVSSDGSRVFFEAAPGSNCSEQKHLYVRVDGESTIDLGAVRFVAANAEGTEVLFGKSNGGAREVILYDTETTSEKLLFTLSGGSALDGRGTLEVSEDLSTIYFLTNERLTPEAPPTIPQGAVAIYRYDVPAGKLTFVDAASNQDLAFRQLSPDGRYLYFSTLSVEGVPGGAGSVQVYRYDSDEGLVQCMSCASPFDPEPKLSSFFGEVGGGGMLESRTGYPRSEFASNDGDYVFFDTPSALLPEDVDGEVPPESNGSERHSHSVSVSSDVYEWRKPGIDGCAHVQGCLALITNGRGGFINLFLGTDESGRDAFIYTGSELGPRDNDSAGDIYDARIDGGEPPAPSRPVECEGDACSNPPGAPNDATPSSLTFSGSGNLVESPVATPVVKAKKPKPKKKSRAKKKAKHAKRARGSSRKNSGGRVKIVKSSRGSK